jgi:hypothetical protein
MRFECLVNLTVALAKSGKAVEAREALSELDFEHHPSFVYLDPEMVLARAWVSACQGAVSEAIAAAREAAAIASRMGQLAHEVLALQAAV